MHKFPPEATEHICRMKTLPARAYDLKCTKSLTFRPVEKLLKYIWDTVYGKSYVVCGPAKNCRKRYN